MSSDYRLKKWTEHEALAAIEEGKHIITAYHDGSISSRYLGLDFADYLITIEKETLLRFPQADNYDMPQFL